MNIQTGVIISHYKVIEQVGGGGMGVVYTAGDTKVIYIDIHHIKNQKRAIMMQTFLQWRADQCLIQLFVVDGEA